MQQELEKEILRITAELGESRNDYEALRVRYTKEWSLRTPDANSEFVKQLGDLSSEMAHYQKLFNELSANYATLISKPE
jgi:hypothetical protein